MDPETRLQSIAAMQDMRAREDAILNDPNLLDVICANVANGGSLINLCTLWRIPYSVVTNFIRQHKDFDHRYQRALKDRTEWVVERVLLEVRRIGLRDARRLHNAENGLKQPSEWDDDDASTVASYEVEELYDNVKGPDRVQIGLVKKVKYHDKGKSLEQLMRSLGQFMDNVQVSFSLEDLLQATYDRPRPAKQTVINE